VFLQEYLVTAGRRPHYGVFWGNLALARPTVCPAVLLELGFMINPQEFEWIANRQAQTQLAQSLALGLEQWLRQGSPSPGLPPP
jgi:N-acetylmuramoyl-L-alanine amidase